jgi:hypothetical protein
MAKSSAPSKPGRNGQIELLDGKMRLVQRAAHRERHRREVGDLQFAIGGDDIRPDARKRVAPRTARKEQRMLFVEALDQWPVDLAPIAGEIEPWTAVLGMNGSGALDETAGGPMTQLVVSGVNAAVGPVTRERDVEPSGAETRDQQRPVRVEVVHLAADLERTADDAQCISAAKRLQVEIEDLRVAFPEERLRQIHQRTRDVRAEWLLQLGDDR